VAHLEGVPHVEVRTSSTFKKDCDSKNLKIKTIIEKLAHIFRFESENIVFLS